jgi:hypothetical protein
MRIAEELAAADAQNMLCRADVAAGHYELGTICMKGARYRDAERRFAEAFERFRRIAAADSGNAENRTFMARSGRGAGEACAAQVRSASSVAERSERRARAVQWLEHSLALFRELRASGALAGEDVAAPAQLEQAIAQLRQQRTR